MKFFRHYKNKPYKYIGEAKHSETLEDVVIYETRYQNENGRLWVRPKKMFFESVEIGGQILPRFKKIPLELKTTNQISENEISAISVVLEKAFGEWDRKWFFSKFDKHDKFFLVTAYIESQPVAFKLGYEISKTEFYSWLGGVIPEHRGLGIAADLMEVQHQWCQKNGYQKVQTKTQNRFRDMLLLNLRFGFAVTGFDGSDQDGPKIILEKTLNENR